MMEPNHSQEFDMHLIGSFLSCASRGDKVGLNQMLRDGISPDVQDYDKRTALHLAASEGHASIIELLLLYKANVNLKDRWQRTALTDAKLYGHKDICRILEVNGGRDPIGEDPLGFPREEGLTEANIDLSELDLEQSKIIDQGVSGVSQKVKWRGTWVVKTMITTGIYYPGRIKLSAKEMSLLRELRHPNILEILGAIEHEDEMILITEYLSKGNLADILRKKLRLDLQTAVRYALDIAKGMNYLHQHKPYPIIHNKLCSRNLLLDDGGHLKIGEYWIQMLYGQKSPHENSCSMEGMVEIGQRNGGDDFIQNLSYATGRDLYSFALIFYEESHKFEPKFKFSRCPVRIQKLIRDCLKQEPMERPTFALVIRILEEEAESFVKPSCPVC
ncbi:probable serine/threonine-protein kinase DDB_G0271682 isoform X2 [Amborella trichopoda]|uniref:probable serine/threonine-protein kinase DDB_G0271682 isoform X2 n=1 Tax=Amborella trichopoda TaxID=13333 RepID=UPI0009C05502|nr:probable serine/threonine-protein kinase DDB_G0271682 isoform X2 [Amborella trichopoda]|eukprot:XP_020519200.1 probable serine/threonine-protein kinase DDB_G0271682 isoform X2 [Amborella trichopoda]